MRTICHYRFYISVIHFSNDLIYARRLVFDLIYKEELLGSSWSTLKPLRFLLWQFKEVKVFLARFSETSVLIFFSGTPKGSQVTGSI